MGRAQFSHDFNESEFSVSASHPDLVEDVPPELVHRMQRLAIYGLQIVRDRTNQSMRILSGYRSPELNAMVGGSRTSQHVLAEAADFTCHDIRKAVYDIIELIQEGRLNAIGQIIYYPSQSFVHMALTSQRFSVPTLCIKWPAEEYNYTPCEPTREAFDQMVPPHLDPSTV